MTNHVHLLVTPETGTGTAKLMQAVGRRYVQYINRSYRRTGKPPTVPCFVASWMKKPLATFGLPCHRDSRWAVAILLTKSVRQRGSGARRRDRGDQWESRINPAIQKHKPISDSELRG